MMRYFLWLLVLGPLGIAEAWAQTYETIGFPMVNEGAAYFADFAPNGLQLAARVRGGEGSLEGAVFKLQLPAICKVYSREEGWVVEADPRDEDRVTYGIPCPAGAQWVFTGAIVPRGLPRGSSIRWWLEVEGDRRAEQSYPIVIVEIPPSQQPQRLRTGLFAARLSGVPEEILEDTARFIGSLGINLVWDYDYKRAPAWRKYGIQVALEEAGYAGVGDYPPGDSDEYPAIDAEGKRSGISPGYIFRHPETALAHNISLNKGIGSRHDVLSWDWEYTAGQMGREAPASSFDPLTLEEFEKWSGLSVQGLTPQEIRTRYHSQWRAWDNFLLRARMKVLYDAAKSANPDLKIGWLPGNGATTDPQDPDTRMSQQIPWHTNDDGTVQYLVYTPWEGPDGQRFFDIFMPMYYYYGLDSPRYLLEQVEAVRPTLKGLEFAVTLVGQGDLYEKSMVETDPGLTRMQLLACAVGGAGASFYPVNWGARHWAAVAQACREIAATEDILLEGTREASLCRLEPLNTRFLKVGDQSIPSPPAQRHLLTRVMRHKGRLLLAVFNFDLDRPAFYRAAFPGLKGDWTVYDVSERRQIIPRFRRRSFSAEELKDGLLLSTPADWGVSLYVLQPAELPPPTSPHKKEGLERVAGYTLSESIERDYRNCRTTFADQFPPGAKGSGCRVGLVQTPDGPRLQLANRRQKFLIDYDKGARICEWVVGDRQLTRWVEDTTWNGGLGNDQFWVPTPAHFPGDSKSVYEPVSWGVQSDGAVATFRRRLVQPLLRGLEITKSFCIHRDSTAITVDYTYSNQGEGPLTFTPWLHHQIAPGVEQAAALQGGTGFENLELRFQGDRGVATFSPRPNGIWKVPGATFTSWQNEQFETQEDEHITAGWASITHAQTGDQVRFTFDYDELFEVFSWSSLGDMTFEWCYRVRTLQPHETWSTTIGFEYRPPPRE